MTLNEYAQKIHETALSHGWYDKERPMPELLMLMVSELSEALEEYRAGRPLEWYDCDECQGKPQPCAPADISDCLQYGRESECPYRSKKPEGIAVEVVDCLIRILDTLAYLGVDIDGVVGRKMAYNETRPYRHGGKVC